MPVYATGIDLCNAYDSRRVGDLCSDSGVRDPSPATNPIVLSLLTDASEMVRAAARVGNRYTDADLDALAADTSSYLRRLVVDLCYGLLVSRRGQAADQIGSLAPRYVDALRDLDRLRQGDLLLGITLPTDKHPDAGLPASVSMAPRSSDATRPLSSYTRVFGVPPGSSYSRYPY